MLLGAVERSLKNAGLGPGSPGRVVVACSGGPDSVALAHAVVRCLGARRVIVGHVDHAVRPGSAADAAFVADFAQALGAELSTARLPPGAASEARLRALRYQALERFRDERGAELILLGHTADDQAETVLFGFVRSTRLLGLRGMPVRRGALLRPLLTVERSEVLAYLAGQGLRFRDDPSNREAHYLRSRLRKELLPLIEARYRPGLSRRLARFAQTLAEPPRPPPPVEPEPTWLGGWRDLGFAVQISRGPVPLAPPAGHFEAAFDAARLGAPRVRMARPGDRIQPFGMLGHRKLKDLYRELGVPAGLREALPVVEADGEVVWVPGIARAAVAPISETTLEVWVFCIQPAPLLPGGQSQVTLGTGEGPTKGPNAKDQ